jgi:serine/threonine protein kinase
MGSDIERPEPAREPASEAVRPDRGAGLRETGGRSFQRDAGLRDTGGRSVQRDTGPQFAVISGGEEQGHVPYPPSLAQRYDFIRDLGAGAFSRVVEARHRASGDRVAIKLVPTDAADANRAERELRVQLGLHHPRVIACTDGGVTDGVVFMIQELAAGTLEDRLGIPGSRRQNWESLGQVAEALAYLRSQGVIHRDLKPSNVLLTEEGAKIGDLGLALASKDDRLTAKGVLLGTPAYMSPEQARGEELTAASDVYSLAVLFYQAIEGRLPYAEVSPMRLVVEIGKGRVRSLRKGRELLSRRAQTLLERALSPLPERRPDDLVELAQIPLVRTATRAPARTVRMTPPEGQQHSIGFRKEPKKKDEETLKKAKKVPKELTGDVLEKSRAAPPPPSSAMAWVLGGAIGLMVAVLALMVAYVVAF